MYELTSSGSNTTRSLESIGVQLSLTGPSVMTATAGSTTVFSLLNSITLPLRQMAALLDPEAAFVALNGTLGAFAAATVAGATYSTMRGLPTSHLALAASTGMNGGIFGAIFFHLREYACVPALALLLPDRHHRLYTHDTAQTWWDMRTTRVVESSIAGGVTATLNALIKRRLPGAVVGAPGALRASLVAGAVLCPIAQLLFNETRVLRVKFSGVDRLVPPERTAQEKLERAKSALGILTPGARAAAADERALEQLRKEKEEADARLTSLQQKIRERDEGK